MDSFFPPVWTADADNAILELQANACPAPVRRQETRASERATAVHVLQIRSKLLSRPGVTCRRDRGSHSSPFVPSVTLGLSQGAVAACPNSRSNFGASQIDACGARPPSRPLHAARAVERPARPAAAAGGVGGGPSRAGCRRGCDEVPREPPPAPVPARRAERLAARPP